MVARKRDRGRNRMEASGGKKTGTSRKCCSHWIRGWRVGNKALLMGPAPTRGIVHLELLIGGNAMRMAGLRAACN